jgi:hypothetical protein
MAFPDPVHLAVQVEESAGGREGGAPASADRIAAEGARSRPAHEQRPVVLGPPVPMVSSGPQGHHNHPARDPRALASDWLSSLLALEIPLPRGPATNRRRAACVDPADGR